jgi:hypothetical protein
MANRAQPFRQHHIARALKAAAAAGAPNPTVEFHTPDGGKIVVSAGGKGFAKGGTTRMLGPQAANPQRPGVTAHAVRGGAPGPAKASGGPRTSRSPSLAVPAKPGRTSLLKRGR